MIHNNLLLNRLHARVLYLFYVVVFGYIVYCLTALYYIDTNPVVIYEHPMKPSRDTPVQFIFNDN